MQPSSADFAGPYAVRNPTLPRSMLAALFFAVPYEFSETNLTITRAAADAEHQPEAATTLACPIARPPTSRPRAGDTTVCTMRERKRWYAFSKASGNSK
jgi:hypothetical protein